MKATENISSLTVYRFYMSQVVGNCGPYLLMTLKNETVRNMLQILNTI